MPSPKLRTANKVVPPFKLNDFPSQFIDVLAKNLVYYMATKTCMSIEGNEWEQIFAECVGAKWQPSNVGLDDISLSNCCWGAKTVFGRDNLATQPSVRLICGRNSPTYSYGVDKITSEDPNKIGELVLNIWNERVSSVREVYKFVRTVVLVKKKDYSEYLIFEVNTLRYDPELYRFEWNSRGNLEGYDKNTNTHKFTWQPSGSQFTIIEEIPKDRIHLKVKKPEPLDRNTVLNALNFGKDWYTVVLDNN